MIKFHSQTLLTWNGMIPCVVMRPGLVVDISGAPHELSYQHTEAAGQQGVLYLQYLCTHTVKTLEGVKVRN